VHYATGERAVHVGRVIVFDELLASGGWVVGWPVLYANFNPALKNAAWLTHTAATLWFFSLIALFVFLALLTEYWPALSYVWDVLGFLVEFLSLFVG
jgi:hypothetical protein